VSTEFEKSNGEVAVVEVNEFRDIWELSVSACTVDSGKVLPTFDFLKLVLPLKAVANAGEEVVEQTQRDDHQDQTT
jgi:hypothetical protein